MQSEQLRRGSWPLVSMAGTGSGAYEVYVELYVYCSYWVGCHVSYMSCEARVWTWSLPLTLTLHRIVGYGHGILIHRYVLLAIFLNVALSSSSLSSFSSSSSSASSLSSSLYHVKDYVIAKVYLS